MASHTCESSSASAVWLIIVRFIDLDAKKEQMEIIHAFISARNVFDIITIGFDKSLCYICLL